jgi:hypothetical protein
LAVNIPGISVVATKQADTNVQLVFYSTFDGLNPNGDIRFAVVIPAADFTSFNTTVNGGSSGATLTKTYAQDLNRNDYPLGMTFES